jgi:hypothetical protein
MRTQSNTDEPVQTSRRFGLFSAEQFIKVNNPLNVAMPQKADYYEISKAKNV